MYPCKTNVAIFVFFVSSKFCGYVILQELLYLAQFVYNKPSNCMTPDHIFVP